jgi:tetratricopeptide (TPR) repeat protein
MHESGTKAGRLLILGIWLGICLQSAGAQARSSISGFVLDTDQRPIGQIIVELRNEFNSVIGRTRTEGSGRFFFSGLGHGRYILHALPLGTGFSEQSVEVEISGIGIRGQMLADNVNKDIYLKPRRSSEATPAKNAVIYAQAVPQDAEALYKDAVSDLDRGNADTGIANLEKAVAVFPTYFAALHRLGVVRLTQNRFADAIEMFNRALAVNDRSFNSLYGLAYAQYVTRKFTEAVSSLEKAVELKPDSLGANLLLGTAQRITKDFANAEKALKKAARLAEGTSPDVHWQLALLYGRDMNRFEEAVRELELYLKLSPNAPNKDDVEKLIKRIKEKAKGTG